MLSADGSAGHGEGGVDADGAHEGALAGHVGAADEEDLGWAADADVVANAFCGGDERMAELRSVETGRAFEEFGERVGGMLVVVGGEERRASISPIAMSQDRTAAPWELRHASAA